MPIKKVSVQDLKPVINNGKHCILVGKDFLKTPAGNVIESTSEALLERIKADFEGQGPIHVENGSVRQPLVFSAYVLASTKLDFMDGDSGSLSSDLPGWLRSDPCFSPTGGHPIISMYQVAQQSCIKEFLREQGLRLDVWQRYSSEEQGKLIHLFQELLSGLTPSRKSALVNMSWPNGCQFVATFMFLVGRCTSREWAMLIFSRSGDVSRIIGDQPMGGFCSIPDNMNDEEREDCIKSLIDDYEVNCTIAEHFFEAI